ncbi:MAG TPA: hypothetical protein VMG30_18050 [Acidobacteriota bacterium]|nr:hypothetical protein [Acidobacteriota bacterium]
MKRLAILLLAILSVPAVMAQDSADSDERTNNYPFIILDSPLVPFTMRQLDQDYLSAYRLFATAANKKFSPAVSYAIQAVSCLFLLKTMTHEEGHRSILRQEGIDSGTRPFLFEDRGGYVDGVTDQTLKNLRDTKFPTFIRLHTAGFESDYMLATREETLLSFEDESYRNLMVEYLFRKAALLIYFTEGYFKRDSDGAEEADELKRDIVGNDLYGVIRHLFRPTMEFKRYTRYSDLTDEEHGYLQRVQRRTFLNLVNANLIGIDNFRLTDNWKANLGMGHCMGPFGDFIDEKIWLNYGKDLKVNAYLREFENRDNWFFGAGAGINGYPLARRLRVSGMLHYWKQPLNLSFTSGAGKTGGAIDLDGSYRLLDKNNSYFRSLALDVGMIYKTAGFLPEETSLSHHLGLRFGLHLGFRNN